MFDMFWDWGYRRRIGDAERDAARAQHKADRLDADLRARTDALEDRCEKAMLVCATLWSILQEELGVDEKKLVDRLRELDLADGHLDEQGAEEPRTCASCGRAVATRHPRCIYCGAEL